MGLSRGTLGLVIIYKLGIQGAYPTISANCSIAPQDEDQVRLRLKNSHEPETDECCLVRMGCPGIGEGVTANGMNPYYGLARDYQV